MHLAGKLGCTPRRRIKPAHGYVTVVLYYWTGALSASAKYSDMEFVLLMARHYPDGAPSGGPAGACQLGRRRGVQPVVSQLLEIRVPVRRLRARGRAWLGWRVRVCVRGEVVEWIGRRVEECVGRVGKGQRWAVRVQVL